MDGDSLPLGAGACSWGCGHPPWKRLFSGEMTCPEKTKSIFLRSIEMLTKKKDLECVCVFFFNRTFVYIQTYIIVSCIMHSYYI